MLNNELSTINLILVMIASLGALLIGFKMLSENVEKLATKGLKKLFNKTSKNPIAGVGIGAVTTALVESSAATTVMVVGLVNAGVMSLYQATAIIMGANIGTTVTAQIVALQSFDFSMFAIILTFIGMILVTFFRKDKVKTLGLALAGLGLVFFGLKFLSSGLNNLSDSVEKIFQVITNPFLLLLLGFAVTALFQSSTAVTSILISMAAAGIMIGNGGNCILYVILGTNIGTCVTAVISSIGANANAKRASIIHLMFNTFGAVLFMVILLVFPGFMDKTFAKWFAGHPETQIAMFHTFFNLACTIFFFPFIKVFVWLSQKIIKDKVVKKDKLLRMDERMLAYPGVALNQLTKEIDLMGYEAISALNLAVDDFINKEENNKGEIDKLNEKLELMNDEVIEYLVKISSKEVTIQDEKMISGFHNNLNDILRIGELADNITKYTKSVVKDALQFSDAVIIEISQMRDSINELYKYVEMTFSSRSTIQMNKIQEIEDGIDNMRTKLIDEHLERLNQGKCQPQSSGVFVNLVSNLERAADHLTYIAETVK